MKLNLHKPSILKRLVMASCLALPLVMLFSALMLDKAMKDSLIAAEHEKLRAQIYQLLTAVEFDPDLYMPDVLAESRFSQLDSGLYGIIQVENGPQWVSSSADLKNITDLQSLRPWEKYEHHSDESTLQFGEFSLADEKLFASRLSVTWEDLDSKKVDFMVLHRQADLQRELSSFRWQLGWWLACLILGLIIAQTWVLKFGLQPLQQLADEIKALQEGDRDQLSETYVKELQPLADNMNQLVQSLRQQQLRFRHALDDLAHSLKTPLTILLGELSQSSPLDTHSHVVTDQVLRMQDIIQHQLKRANRGVMRLQASPQPVAVMVERLLSAMACLYQDKNISYESDIANNICFLGVADDLMEVLGNLIENAFKYSVTKVKVSAKIEAGKLYLDIEDDGAGISAEQRQYILQRGVRGDSKTLGQGLGLAVALDIVDAYQGEILTSDSIFNGAKFSLVLPGKLQEIS